MLSKRLRHFLNHWKQECAGVYRNWYLLVRIFQDVLYIHRDFSNGNRSGWKSLAISCCPWRKGCRLLQKYLDCLNCFLAPSYVWLWTKKWLCVYFHKQPTSILKKRWILVTINKREVLRSFGEAFEFAKESALVSVTSSAGLQTLDAKSVIHSTDICCVLSILFCLAPLAEMRRTRNSERINGNFSSR